MTLSTRKKVLIGAGGVLGVLIAALLLAPVFLDLNQYKPQIAAEVRKATGRELVISGPASLSLLPMPAVSVAGVKFFNERGAQNPTMVEVKSVTVKPALWALLVGRIDVDEVVLVDALLRLGAAEAQAVGVGFPLLLSAGLVLADAAEVDDFSHRASPGFSMPCTRPMR